MTKTRLWQAGLESCGSNSHIYEFTANNAAASSTTQKKSGTYSLRLLGKDTYYAYKDIPATYQLRFAYHDYNAIASEGTSKILEVLGTGSLFYLYAESDAQIALYVGGVQQDTYDLSTPLNAFKHIGVDCKIDASAGWVYVYIDGIEVMSFDGNTGSTQATRVKWYGWADQYTYEYKDDFFIDDTTGEAAPAAVPDRRFSYISPNGNGNYADGVGSDGNSTDNYAQVDELPASMTDYVALDAADEKDTYTMTTVSPPAGFTFAAVIPCLYILKTDAEMATQAAPLLRYSSTDVEGTAVDLGTSMGLKWERFTTKPGGGNWDQAAIDGLEVGVQGEGAF